MKSFMRLGFSPEMVQFDPARVNRRCADYLIVAAICAKESNLVSGATLHEQDHDIEQRGVRGDVNLDMTTRRVA
jgi:hypothetical protein